MTRKPRQISVIILITLAELAWIAAFGLLFAYRGKIGEVRGLKRDYAAIQHRLNEMESGATNLAALENQMEATRTARQNAEAQLSVFKNVLNGVSPAEAKEILLAGTQAKETNDRLEVELERLKGSLAQRDQREQDLINQLRRSEAEQARANYDLDVANKKLNALPANVGELAGELSNAARRIVTLEQEVEQLRGTNGELASILRFREVGEFSVRRELTGLPSKDLHRVVFLVDTSSSMKSSPAWASARGLMRTWMENLSVDECALVNFNDSAVVFPSNGYLRLRSDGGTVYPEARQQLLAAFDRSRSGVYSDLLKGLKAAYGLQKPDVIVLFTDGHPHVSGKGDEGLAQEILGEVAKHPEIPILAVALGSYEIEGVGGPRERANPAISFLKRLSGSTGGNFLGR